MRRHNQCSGIASAACGVRACGVCGSEVAASATRPAGPGARSAQPGLRVWLKRQRTGAWNPSQSRIGRRRQPGQGWGWLAVTVTAAARGTAGGRPRTAQSAAVLTWEAEATARRGPANASAPRAGRAGRPARDRAGTCRAPWPAPGGPAPGPGPAPGGSIRRREIRVARGRGRPVRTGSAARARAHVVTVEPSRGGARGEGSDSRTAGSRGAPGPGEAGKEKK